MNDLDGVTFAAFARRFSRIEQRVPDEARAAFTPLAYRHRHGAFGRLAIAIGVVLVLGAALAIFSLGSWPAPITSPSPTASRPAVTLPPDSAAPDIVLAAYLSALQARDCDAAEQFVGSFVYRWNDALCGDWTHITAFRITGVPHVIAPNRINQGTVLTITGGGIYPPGDIECWFELQQATSGAWRIIQALPGGPLPPNTPLPWPTPGST